MLFSGTVCFKCSPKSISSGICGISRRFKSTIYALSTAIRDRGCPIAAIRVSGSHSLETLQLLTGRSNLKIIPRQCTVHKLHHPSTLKLIDIAMAVYYAGPRSYTGEDMCEYFVHGSSAVISTMLQVLGSMDNVRQAEPGEFTKRAFINGKLDLTEAEAVHDLVSSQTESQRLRALDGLSGQTKNLYLSWREGLIRAAAHFEANIDFGEDELLDEESLISAKTSLLNIRDEIETFLTDATRKSELIKNGLQIAIVGPPNAGKSSLINLLCQRDISIVSPIKGTTRDIVEATLDINGYVVRICDTAGLRELSGSVNDVDLIEAEGIRRALKRMEQSDIVIYMIDCSDNWNGSQLSQDLDSLQQKSSAQVLTVLNKMDLVEKSASVMSDRSLRTSVISCKTHHGIDHLMQQIEAIITELAASGKSELGTFITERHHVHLKNMCTSIDRAIEDREDIAISAHHIRGAIKECSRLTGHIGTDDILDVVFRDFCIGK
ncbi:tRNA modification GTPase GTPBP3, mitochondrial [Halotydeus destructor]|nr:tRNA modification GTPase GTPBP3, mitochondrial [Halotydeus destructor]